MHRPFRRLLLTSAAASLSVLAVAGPRPRLRRARDARRQRQAAQGLDPGRLGRRQRALRDVVHIPGRRSRVRLHRPPAGSPVEGRTGVGDWTLQRLEREVAPPAPAAAEGDCANCAKASAGSAEEVYNTRIDALDITILRGGGESVGQWARDHGFQLTPDAPEVLDFYAARSPIFMAARFNADAARQRDQQQGEGTPIHLTIPMDNPWVPLRILGLGKGGEDIINANVFLLTPARPNLLPLPVDGVVEERSEEASKSLLDDLRSDTGMSWVPAEMWLTYLRIGEQTGRLHHDLAIDKAGTAEPSRVMAGLEAPPAPTTTTSSTQHHGRAHEHHGQAPAEGRSPHRPRPPPRRPRRKARRRPLAAGEPWSPRPRVTPSRRLPNRWRWHRPPPASPARPRPCSSPPPAAEPWPPAWPPGLSRPAPAAGRARHDGPAGQRPRRHPPARRPTPP